MEELDKGAGQIFQSAEAFRQMICKYVIANHFNYRFERNCRQRNVVRCDASDCPFYICVRGAKNTQLTSLKEFRGQHKHSVGSSVRWLYGKDNILHMQRCSKCSEVGHTRRTCRNPYGDFDATYEGDVVQVKDLFDDLYVVRASWT